MGWRRSHGDGEQQLGARVWLRAPGSARVLSSGPAPEDGFSDCVPSAPPAAAVCPPSDSSSHFIHGNLLEASPTSCWVT